VSDRIPVLLDTDIGTNLDDALALAYLLRQPRCELLGVTTVTGRPEVRAQLADAVCRALGRPNVPVHAGAGQALAGHQIQPEVPQSPVLARWPHRERIPSDTAVEFLQKTIRSRPGEITLLTVGALTNVARLYAADPEIPRLLRAHVLMAGLYTETVSSTERNVSGDPEAAAAVFAAGVPTRCLGREVTAQCRISAEDFRRRLTHTSLRIMTEMAEIWLASHQDVLLHDALAAACILDPGLCAFQPGRVAVELQGEHRGVTIFAPDPAGRHQVARTAKPEQFLDHLFANLNA